MPIAEQKYKRLTVKNVDRAPERAGVYALYAGSELLFLGGTDGKTKATIRSRLRKHIGATPKEADRYKRELTGEPVARLKALLREYTKVNGHLPKYNDTNGNGSS